jgi:hypothetical protein
MALGGIIWGTIATMAGVNAALIRRVIAESVLKRTLSGIEEC